MPSQYAPVEVEVDQKLTISANLTASAPDPSHGTISVYLRLVPRPSHRWVRAFQGRLPGLAVAVPDEFELCGSPAPPRAYRNYRLRSSRLGSIRQWLRRLTFRGPSHLVVHGCPRTADAVAAALEQARTVVHAVNAAVNRVTVVQLSVQTDRARAEKELRDILANATAPPSDVPRKRRRQQRRKRSGYG